MKTEILLICISFSAKAGRKKAHPATRFGGILEKKKEAEAAWGGRGL